MPSSPQPKIKMATNLQSTLSRQMNNVPTLKNKSNPFEDENYGHSQQLTPMTHTTIGRWTDSTKVDRPKGLRLFSSQGDMYTGQNIPNTNYQSTIIPGNNLVSEQNIDQTGSWFRNDITPFHSGPDDNRLDKYQPRSYSPNACRKFDFTDTRDSTNQSHKEQKLGILHSMPKHVMPPDSGSSCQT